MTDDLMPTIDLARTTAELIIRGQGILAADESIATI